MFEASSSDDGNPFTIEIALAKVAYVVQLADQAIAQVRYWDWSDEADALHMAFSRAMLLEKGAPWGRLLRRLPQRQGPSCLYDSDLDS